MKQFPKRYLADGVYVECEDGYQLKLFTQTLEGNVIYMNGSVVNAFIRLLRELDYVD